MHTSSSSSSAAVLLAACLSWTARTTTAETIVIEASELLLFNPMTVNASAGDVLEFHFHPFNHSVVMGDLAHACQPAATGGFWSGFLPVSMGENVKRFFIL